jgi:DNA primase
VYLANQACIELHAFLSTLDRIDEPDQLIFDLDPPDGSRFDDVRACALALRELLTGELGLPTFVKTTGGHGLHVHVPLKARQHFDTTREFARLAAEVLAARNPDLVTTEQRKAKRGPRIYADIMRNAYAQLAVAPDSVRARPGAPVATPLSWHELDDTALRPERFTLRTVPGRIREADRSGGPWAGLSRRRPGPRSPCGGSWRDRRRATRQGSTNRRDTPMTVLGNHAPTGGEPRRVSGHLRPCPRQRSDTALAISAAACLSRETRMSAAASLASSWLELVSAARRRPDRQAHLAGADQDALVQVRRHRGPDRLGLAQEDAGARGPDAGELGQERADGCGLAACLVPEPAQVPTPSLDQQLRGIPQHGGGALVVAAVVPAAEGVHAVLPACRPHRARGAVPGFEQLAGRADRDVGGDAGAQQRRQHQQLVQRGGPVGQPDSGLFCIATPIALQQHANHFVVLPGHAPPATPPRRAHAHFSEGRRGG